MLGAAALALVNPPTQKMAANNRAIFFMGGVT